MDLAQTSYFSRTMRRIYLFFGVFFSLLSCDSGGQTIVSEKQVEEVQVLPPSIGDTTILFDFQGEDYAVDIKAPKAEFKGTILVLQGWNFPNTSWCDSTDLCEKALEEGYFLILPEMKKSIYHWQAYPETRADWQKYPTRDWLINTVCSSLNEDFNLLSPDHNNNVLGLSTGGRGALIIAQENPSIFKAGASLSGDYDQSAFPNDNLYRGYFGTDSSKWNAKENPISFIKEWKVPMYIGHGAKDNIVPVEHMLHLQSLTDSLLPDLEFKYHLSPHAGHDYYYWGTEVGEMLEFFDGIILRSV